jgi:LmbE family N-acetylglucosaminyl deacetylase
MTVLVVAAHPDDEVLGCGATVAGMSAKDDVHIVILGEGLTSRSETRRPSPDMTGLHEDARTVAEMLGARSVRVKNLPDNRFDELALLDVVKVVESVVDELKPGVIFTHHPGDLNVDHQVTFRAVLTATRPVLGCPVRDIMAFEVASSTQWAFQHISPSFRPNVFVDVEKTIQRKVAAMEAYHTEARPFPHPRSSEALLAQARWWGATCGLQYAEAFELIRSIRS